MRACLAVLTVLVFAAPEVFGLGSDHPKGPVDGHAHWPQGLKELVNREGRVHGFWVNDEDVFFYAGDTQALNQFLEVYAKLPKTALTVVIHPGLKNARSPWERQDRDLPTQWSLHTGGDSKDGRFVTRVDVWLGGRIRLEHVRLPANVEAASGGEIERFVAEHNKKK